MQTAPTIECHGLDTPERVCFYEQDYYVLSNFSAFNVKIWGLNFQTAEHAYHWKKFAGVNDDVAGWIFYATSAHHAFKVAAAHKGSRRKDWDEIKVEMMRQILREKVTQHDYVERKLHATGTRELVENSWRDDFWGWGPNRDGQNMLGKLWMEVRDWVKTQPEV
jgi:N-glycosidase YbiA